MHNFSDSNNTRNTPSEPVTFSMRSLVAILFKRRRTILFVVSACIAAAAVAGFVIEPTYRAHLTLILHRDESLEKAALLRVNMPYNSGSDAWLQAEIAMLHSFPVVSHIVQTLNIYPKAVAAKDGLATDRSEMLKKAVQALQTRLLIKNDKGSNLVTISYDAPSPEQATAVLRELVDRYLAYRAEVSKEAEEYAFFDQQLQITENKLLDLQRRQAEFKQNALALAPEQQRELLLTRLKKFEDNLTAVRERRMQREARLAAIMEGYRQNGYLNIPATETTDRPSRERHLAKLKDDLLTMTVELKRLQQKFLPEYIKVAILQAQIAEVKKQLDREIQEILENEKVAIRALQTEERALRASIDQINGKIKALSLIENEYKRITRDIDDTEQVVSMLVKQREEARISLAKIREGVNLTLLSPPEVGSDPFKPNRKLLLAVALFLGLGLGFGLAFTLEYFDHTLNSPEQWERHVGIPSLGAGVEIEVLRQGLVGQA